MNYHALIRDLAVITFATVALASSDMIPGSLPALRRADWRAR